MTTIRETIITPERRVAMEKIGKSCRCNEIEATGFWVNNFTGEGLRITEDSLKADHSPVFGYISNQDLFTLVSADPYAPIGKLRRDAADLDLPVRF